MRFYEGVAQCNQDTMNVTDPYSNVDNFLHLPRPRSNEDNQIYMSTINHRIDEVWLDITVGLPTYSSKESIPWQYNDSSPVEWFNWDSRQPYEIYRNNRYKNEKWSRKMYVSMQSNGLWKDIYMGANLLNDVICTFALSPGAVNTCTWLNNYVIRKTII